MGVTLDLRDVDKERVIRRFTSALPHYEDNAVAQHHIGERLIAILTARGRRQYNHVLEYGCGTGSFTRRLAQALDVERWTLNDLCPDCEKYVSVHPASFHAGPAESMSHVDTYDLIASASAFQWFADPRGVIRQAARLLRRNGVFLFNTFSSDNLPEIRTLTDRGLQYPTAAHLEEWLGESFSAVEVEEETIVLDFDSPREVLLHLKRTGVTATPENGDVWTPRRFDSFDKAYRERYSTPSGQVTLTYAPLYFLAERNDE